MTVYFTEYISPLNSTVPPEESKLKSNTSNVNEGEFLKDYSSGPSRKERAKSIKKTSRSIKIQTHLSQKAVDSSSSTRVSSTTSPTSMDQGVERIVILFFQIKLLIAMYSLKNYQYSRPIEF